MENREESEKTFKSTYKGLPFIHISKAADNALADIKAERSDEQLGLYCEWSSMNRGQGKYFRFNHITQFAAPSGHGKSYLINQLHDHFTDCEDIYREDKTLFKRGINNAFKDKIVVLHFGLEMDASDEVIRNISRKIAKSHNYILSSEWNPTELNFNRITDEEFAKIENRINYIRNKPIYYVEMTGTIQQLYHTVKYVSQQNPNKKLVISIDHTLLVRRGASEKSDADLISAVGFLALLLRKEFKAMVILLAQMNQNIKSVERTSIPRYHYPMDSDIYWGSQINWICDNIWIAPYRPELINIQKYGIDAFDTKDLVVAACVKSRKGKLGDCYFNQALNVGRFNEFTPTSAKMTASLNEVDLPT